MTPHQPDWKRTSSEDRSREERDREVREPVVELGGAPGRVEGLGPEADPEADLQYSPVTAGLVMSVLTAERLAEVMGYFERYQETARGTGAAWLLLGALRREELAVVAARVNVPAQGRFHDLLARLRGRCQ